MRQTKYYPNYGYISGTGIFDDLMGIYNSFPDVPNSIKEDIKDGLIDIGKKGAKALGSKIGDKLADAITKKKTEKIRQGETPIIKYTNLESEPSNTKSEEDIRRKVLEDLKLIPRNSKKIVYGEGIRYL